MLLNSGEPFRFVLCESITELVLVPRNTFSIRRYSVCVKHEVNYFHRNLISGDFSKTYQNGFQYLISIFHLSSISDIIFREKVCPYQCG